MAAPGDSMFRAVALERMSSPEQLDLSRLVRREVVVHRAEERDPAVGVLGVAVDGHDLLDDEMAHQRAPAVSCSARRSNAESHPSYTFSSPGSHDGAYAIPEVWLMSAEIVVLEYAEL